jgi:SAM-dependent methyltransferase
MSSCDLKKKYIKYGKEIGWWRTGTAFQYYCRHQLFTGIDLKGKKILDVGCGNGRFSLWAAVHGADEVLGLEPSIEGSRGNSSLDVFRSAIEDLGLGNVFIKEVTFQDYDSPSLYWDGVLFSASINHLSEEACIELRRNKESQNEYLNIFSKLRTIVAPGGWVVITDCSSSNFYRGLGIRHPFLPTIEWHKHQPPDVWVALLLKAGFVKPRITWLSPAKYLHFGALFSNRIYAYLTRSLFRLEVSAPQKV